jgi:replicative DNA helicase
MGLCNDTLHRHHTGDVKPGSPCPATIPTPISLVPRAIGILPADSSRAALRRWSQGGIPRSPARLTTPRPIGETLSLSARDIGARAKRVQMERGLGMLIIDYLQLMTAPTMRSDNRQQEVANISRDLKVLAKELNVPVIALSQLSREIDHRHPPVPVLSDIRESGAIEQDSDVVMFIYRGDIYEPNTDNGVAQLIVAKRRNGPTDTVRMRFNRTYVRFEELPPVDHARPQGAL